MADELDQDKFLTAAQLAPKLNLSERTVVRYAKSGKIPACLDCTGRLQFYWPHVRASMLADVAPVAVSAAASVVADPLLTLEGQYKQRIREANRAEKLGHKRMVSL
jgi:hypothetical protein